MLMAKTGATFMRTSATVATIWPSDAFEVMRKRLGDGPDYLTP